MIYEGKQYIHIDETGRHIDVDKDKINKGIVTGEVHHLNMDGELYLLECDILKPKYKKHLRKSDKNSLGQLLPDHTGVTLFDEVFKREVYSNAIRLPVIQYTNTFCDEEWISAGTTKKFLEECNIKGTKATIVHYAGIYNCLKEVKCHKTVTDRMYQINIVKFMEVINFFTWNHPHLAPAPIPAKNNNLKWQFPQWMLRNNMKYKQAFFSQCLTWKEWCKVCRYIQYNNLDEKYFKNLPLDWRKIFRKHTRATLYRKPPYARDSPIATKERYKGGGNIKNGIVYKKDEKPLQD